MRQEANYEVHIVGYEGTDLSQVPSPFFLNAIELSTQGFACIATSEQENLEQAYQDFAEGAQWSESMLRLQPAFGVHVKLEQVREQTFYEERQMKRSLQPRQIQTHYVQSPIVSAWDVHLDGEFHPQLREVLHNDGYIILDYLSSQGENLSTLTMHFLRPEECVQEYRRICEAINSAGGLQGNIYYEDPLAFVVYGETIPRPIVRGFG